MPLRLATWEQAPSASSLQTQPVAFSYQMAEIEDVERMHDLSFVTVTAGLQHTTAEPEQATSPTLTNSTTITTLIPTSPQLIPASPQLPSASSTPPRLPTPSIPLREASLSLDPAIRQFMGVVTDFLSAQSPSDQAAYEYQLTPHSIRRYTIPRLLEQRANLLAPDQAIIPRRRTHSTAFHRRTDAISSIDAPVRPRRHLRSVYAVQVVVGDILKYGNRINDGCRVIAAYLDERAPDLTATARATQPQAQSPSPYSSPSAYNVILPSSTSPRYSPSPSSIIANNNHPTNYALAASDSESDKEDGEIATANDEEEAYIYDSGPVRLDGTVRIHWQCRGEEGGTASQLFEGLTELEILREEEGKGNGEGLW